MAEGHPKSEWSVFWRSASVIILRESGWRSARILKAKGSRGTTSAAFAGHPRHGLGPCPLVAARGASEHRRLVQVRPAVSERPWSLQVCAGTELETHAAQEVGQFAAESRFKPVRYGIAAGGRATRSDEDVDLGVADVVESGVGMVPAPENTDRRPVDY